MKIINTANLITLHDNKILLVKRAYNNEEHGLWSLPGGTKNDNEDIKETLKREINEELGIDIKKYKLLKIYKKKYNDKIVNAHYFLGVIKQDISLNKKELTKYQWFLFDNIPNNLAYDQNEIIKDCSYKIFKKVL